MLRVRLLVISICLAVSGGLYIPLQADAQESFGQSWKDLSPDKRKQKSEQYFSNLPESQQQRLRQNQQRFRALPNNQKRVLCQRFQSQKGYYPPACQGLVKP